MPFLDRILSGVKLQLALRQDHDIEGSRHVNAAIWTHQTNDQGGAIPALWIVYTATPKVVLEWVDVAGEDIPTALMDSADDNGR